MSKIKFSKEFFTEWQKDPKSAAAKYGFNWDDFKKDPNFQGTDFNKLSFSEFEQLFRKSRFSNFFDFEA